MLADPIRSPGEAACQAPEYAVVQHTRRANAAASAPQAEHSDREQLYLYRSRQKDRPSSNFRRGCRMFNAVDTRQELRKSEVRRQQAEVGSQDDKGSRRSQSCKPWRAGFFS